MQTEQLAATRYTGTYPGQADQVREVRRAMAEYLAVCPVADDALLVVSELATNAIVHSTSRGKFFIVRAEVRADYVWVEVEDLGGPWRRRHRDRQHGLDLVEALAGPNGWGARTANDGGRIVWARLDLPAGE